MNQNDREALWKARNRIRRVTGVANFLSREGIEVPQKLNDKFSTAVREKNKKIMELVRHAQHGDDVELMATLQSVREFI